jgi:hypothetical protein
VSLIHTRSRTARYKLGSVVANTKPSEGEEAAAEATAQPTGHRLDGRLRCMPLSDMACMSPNRASVF